MKRLFAEDSMKILEAFSFTRTLYAFDFDGTLSQIVKDPQDATIRDSTDSLLKRLADYAPVAIVSGRSVADLRAHLKFQPEYVVGNHGLEGLEAQPDSLEQARKISAGWKTQLRSYGFEIEDKKFSLAIHYRKSPARKKAKVEILNAISRLSPEPRTVLGKCVVNLLPPGTPHKGMALLELMKKAGATSAFYIGDDDTDEDVFSLPHPRVFTVRVGRKLSSQTRYWIDKQSEMDQVLKSIIGFYRDSRARS